MSALRNMATTAPMMELETMATRSRPRKRSEAAPSAAEPQAAELTGTTIEFDDNDLSAAPPNRLGSRKRTLTPDNVYATVGNVVASGAILVEAAVKPKISGALREKIFLAVTSVNDCRYCKWGHSHWAMAQGVPLEEVNQILAHQIGSRQAENSGEAAAILFAQHYAEQLDEFDPEAIANLRNHFSEAETAEILAYVRFITLTNLTGNTLDSAVDRFRGGLLKGVVAAAVAPLGLALTLIAKFDRQVGMDRIHASDR